MERRLVAILAADVVGYSSMMRDDEAGTLSALKAHRNDLFNPEAEKRGGRIVKLMGDGVLVEFASVVDAVECALAVQRRLAEAAGPIKLRIGVNLGDIIIDGDDIYGDGVNIAARLEALAEPGGICISSLVHESIGNRIDSPFKNAGEQELKNIDRPIRVWKWPAEVNNEPSFVANTNRTFPEKPSIAVLPFTNMSGDEEQEYFVDGMVEDIITALSRFNQLFVIARNSSFVYKGKAVDVKQVGSELGVRYVLEGSVRKASNRVRITGQLIDTNTGSHLWADRFDGELVDIFDLQDRITASVVGAIEPTIRKAEIERSRQKPASNLGAYDLFLQALPLIYTVQDEENLKAFDLLNRAIDLDPCYGPALAHAAWCLVQRITRAWPPAGEDDLSTAISLARRALSADDGDAINIVLGGFTLVMLKQDYATGLEAVRRAVHVNPGSGFVNAMAGCALIFGDDPEAGLGHVERAMALAPLDPSFFSHLSVAGYAQLSCGRADLAAELAERSLALNSQWDSTYWVLIAAYTQLDRLSEAKTIATRLMTLLPKATVSKYGKSLPIRNAQSLEMVLNSLQQAGLPVGD